MKRSRFGGSSERAWVNRLCVEAPVQWRVFRDQFDAVVLAARCSCAFGFGAVSEASGFAMVAQKSEKRRALWERAESWRRRRIIRRLQKVKVRIKKNLLMVVMHKFGRLLRFFLTADAEQSGDVRRNDATLFHAAPRVNRRRVRVRYWRQALVVVVDVAIARNTHPVLGHRSV